MKTNLSSKTLKAIRLYGADACRKAFQMNERGEGANTIANTIPFATIRTTQQADAAINAGRELLQGAKLVEVVEGPNGPTLGGDIKALTQMIASACNVAPRTARNYLSSACEMIEFAADGELSHITARDIVEAAQEIQANIADERRAPKHP